MLNDSQRNFVAGWIQQGLKISEIQSRISDEFKTAFTYMEVRLLVDDLKLIPKDVAPAGPIQTPSIAAAPAPDTEVALQPHNSLPVQTSVHIVMDQIARLGSLVSGKVTFSDGQTADWSLDQSGRLSLAAAQKGYRPSQEDIQIFQLELQKALSKSGF